MPSVTSKSGFHNALFFGICVACGLLAGYAWTVFNHQTEPENQNVAHRQLSLEVDSNSNAETTDITLAKTPYESATRLQTLDEHSTLSGEISDASTTMAAPSTIYPALSYHDGIMRAAPSVASVYARKTDSTGIPDRATTNQGSGVVVDADGIVLTNLHLLQGREDITVVLSDGRVFAGLLIGSDKETDLAVVRIPATGLPYLQLNEASPLRVGDVVLAIGNPYGVGQTVTQGIVSATRRRVANGSLWQNFIQVDAAINPGNSGGALINPYGQLVGVNTAAFRAAAGAVGIGFSIPANLLAQVVPQIIENGSVARGWLGIDVENIELFPNLKQKITQGAVVASVLTDGPAFKSGIKVGDVITRLNGRGVNDATQLLLAVSALPPESYVSLSLLRGPDQRTLREWGKPVEFVPSEYRVMLGTQPPSESTPQSQ